MFGRLLHRVFGRKRRRRLRILSEPFPESWLPHVRRGFAFHDRLPET